MDKTLDPRSRNNPIVGNSASQYLRSYARQLQDALLAIPDTAIDEAYALIRETSDRQGRIYVAGNGGSCAIAAHLCCDWMKGTSVPSLPSLRVQSLTENVSLLTALANDFSYEVAIAEQVKYLGNPGDLLILISSSGNSPNILAAAKAAQLKHMEVIGFTGFDGGELSKMADLSLHVPIPNYGLAEDAHQMLMHVFSQFLLLERVSPARSMDHASRLDSTVG